uniref:cDNA FLJ56789 n=1 Tax=Homo sapiens TaxID=9606 RepID=B4DSF3_HUMAN|nr:unnamed protein product [Homo sapiens]
MPQPRPRLGSDTQPGRPAPPPNTRQWRVLQPAPPAAVPPPQPLLQPPARLPPKPRQAWPQSPPPLPSTEPVGATEPPTPALRPPQLRRAPHSDPKECTYHPCGQLDQVAGGQTDQVDQAEGEGAGDQQHGQEVAACHLLHRLAQHRPTRLQQAQQQHPSRRRHSLRRKH